jgi:hypothetical protein
VICTVAMCVVYSRSMNPFKSTSPISLRFF